MEQGFEGAAFTFAAFEPRRVVVEFDDPHTVKIVGHGLPAQCLKNMHRRPRSRWCESAAL
jgi:hypothetical protein